MKLNLAPKPATKLKLNQTLRSWLPILMAPLDELSETLEPFVEKNPFAQITQNKAKFHQNFADLYKSNAKDSLENFAIARQSLYEKLYSQIAPPLFATPKAQKIANLIIECINEDGYFEYDAKILAEFSSDEVERIRARFEYLEPSGVGAIDFRESFLFQLDELCDDERIYNLCVKIIKDIENIGLYTKESGYNEAIKIIKKFKNPPAIEFREAGREITPDIFIYNVGGNIEIKLNDEYYPEILIDTDGQDAKNDFIAAKIKDARELIDALEMRKATLYKLGLMIIEYQYDYFFGGDIKPMRLKDLADDLGRNPSTISRAIQNKYLSCPRGIVPLKQFFAATAGENENISNAAIKEFLKNLIKDESHAKPLSDEAILAKIQGEFKIKIVRRTITKYRKLLNIASSSERKKIYAIKA